MIKINSPVLNNRFKMIRIQCKPYESLEIVKDQLMAIMNDYL